MNTEKQEETIPGNLSPARVASLRGRQAQENTPTSDVPVEDEQSVIPKENDAKNEEIAPEDTINVIERELVEEDFEQFPTLFDLGYGIGEHAKFVLHVVTADDLERHQGLMRDGAEVGDTAEILAEEYQAFLTEKEEVNEIL